jgi:hypothetical protein
MQRLKCTVRFPPMRSSMQRNVGRMKCRCSSLPETGHLLQSWFQKLRKVSVQTDALTSRPGVIRGSVHYVVEDQPEAVADFIEQYASLHSK